MTPPARTRWTLGVAVLATYAALSFGLGDVYPLSRFEFFGFSVPEDSRVIARPAGGTPREVFAIGAWDCPPPLDLTAAQAGAPNECRSAIQDPVRDRQVARWIHAHPAGEGATTVQVELVRQVIRYDRATGSESITECAITTCQAVP